MRQFCAGDAPGRDVPSIDIDEFEGDRWFERTRSRWRRRPVRSLGSRHWRGRCGGRTDADKAVSAGPDCGSCTGFVTSAGGAAAVAARAGNVTDRRARLGDFAFNVRRHIGLASARETDWHAGHALVC